MTQFVTSLKELNGRASHRKYRNRVNAYGNRVILVWLPLVSMVFYIIGGPKSVSFLLLSSVLSFFVLPKHYVYLRLRKHIFISAWIVSFNIVFYFIEPSFEIGSIDPSLFIAIYIYCIMTSLSLCYTIKNLNLDDYVRWSMIGLFLCPLALWGIIFVRQFSSAESANQINGHIINSLQRIEYNLFGIFTYDNVSYAISYFTLPLTCLWCYFFWTKNNRERIIISMLALIGFYSSLQFFKRSPGVYGFIAGLIVLIYYVIKSYTRLSRKVLFLVKTIIFTLSSSLLIFLLMINYFPNYVIYINNISDIPNDIRIRIWSSAVNLFFADFFKAFRNQLYLSNYAHNFCLDYAADYGIWGFTFACILVIYLISRIIGILYNGKDLVSLTSLLLLCLVFSQLLIILTEPPLPNRLIVWLLSCLTFININDTMYCKPHRKRLSPKLSDPNWKVQKSRLASIQQDHF